MLIGSDDKLVVLLSIVSIVRVQKWMSEREILYYQKSDSIRQHEESKVELAESQLCNDHFRMRNCILDGKANWKYDYEKKEIAHLSQVQPE